MADYIYLLETRLSKVQRAALEVVREIARGRGLTVFLVGGAVRDLTSGSLVRDLDVVVQGNALKLKKDLEKGGARISSELESGQALHLFFPGGVRMELGSTLSASYPKPGKAVLRAGSLQDDLRRRDFTANAMALSLNEGSYGLLMDPLNGVADIENRELRLVSNYGFLDDPVRMIRATRLMARLGWQMEERTRTRYENSKEANSIETMGEFARGYETEEIFHEEEPLRVMRRLEEEGWMAYLFPALSSAKANVAELERLREAQMQLQMQGIYADGAAANFPLLTGKLSVAELAQLKAMFPRQAFVGRIEALDAEAKEFSGQMLTKTAAAPSQAYQLIQGATPEAVLWAAHTTKSAALQAKFKSFYSDWPQARQKLPYVLMQEMRITPELAEYEEVLKRVFFELMDGRLQTTEEMRAYLEPYSPPAPPPPVHLRRPRAAKKDAKASKGRKKSVVQEDAEEASERMDDGDPEDGDEKELAGDRQEESGSVRNEPAEDLDDDESEQEERPERAQPAKKAAVATRPVVAKSSSGKAAPVQTITAKAEPSEALAQKATKSVPEAKTATTGKGAVSTVAHGGNSAATKKAVAPLATSAGKKTAFVVVAPKKSVTPTKPVAKVPLKVAAKVVAAKPSAGAKTAPAKESVPLKAQGKAAAHTGKPAAGGKVTKAAGKPNARAGKAILPAKKTAPSKSKKAVVAKQAKKKR